MEQINREIEQEEVAPLNTNAEEAVNAVSSTTGSSNKREIWIYAHDHSGSTDDDHFYFIRAVRYLNEFRRKVADVAEENVKYLLWDELCKSVPKEKMNEIYDSLHGCGGTYPHEIANWIIAENLQHENLHLWLLTDGEVDKDSMAQCKSKNLGINFKSATLISINKKKWKIDDSISLAFMNDKCLIKTYNEVGNLERVCRTIDGTTEFDFASINCNNFDERYNDLLNYTIGMFAIDITTLAITPEQKLYLEKKATTFIINLKNLSAKLCREYRQLNGGDDGGDDDIIKKDFGTTENEVVSSLFKLEYFINTILEEKKPEAKPSFCVRIMKTVGGLISIIHNSAKNNKVYSFNHLKEMANQFKFDNTQSSTMQTVPEITGFNTPCNAVKFMDVFSLDEACNSPIICFDKNDFIFKEAQKTGDYFTKIIEYPLILINNEKFLAKNEYVCQPYGLDGIKSYMSSALSTDFPVEDPVTRGSLVGGIIPFAFADKWNDYTVSCIFLHGKKVKQSFMDIFYFVIYKKILQLGQLDPTIIDQLKSYALLRIKNGTCKLGFSGLPDEPQDFVPIPIALYYCAQLSTKMFAHKVDHFKKEKLRNFCYTAQYLIEILENCDLELNVDMIRKRTQTFLYVNKFRKLNLSERYISVLHSIFKVKDGFLMNEIVAPEMIDTIKYIDLNFEAPISLKLKSLDLNYFDDKVFLYYTTIYPVDFHISPKTCRPLYLINDRPYLIPLKASLEGFKLKKNKVVTEEITKLNSTRVLSMCRLFIDYVEIYYRYPTFEQFTAYLLSKKSMRHTSENDKTLIGMFATNVLQDLKEIYDIYCPIITDSITITEFILLVRSTISIENRILKETEDKDK